VTIDIVEQTIAAHGGLDLWESASEVSVQVSLGGLAFASLRHKLWWDRLDILYFAAYAIWTYVSTPFLLRWLTIVHTLRRRGLRTSGR
jgi:hypothetical protein